MGPTLLLDLDGTLVDTVPDLAAALNRVMAARGLAPFTEAETARMVGDGVATLIARAFAARGRTPDATAVADYAADPALFVPRASRPFPGVVAGLATLAEAGWRLAVCTNKPEAAARSLLEQLGIGGFMAAIGGGDSFPVRKPDPAHLVATLRAAGGVAERAIMAGDHANDVAAARGAGIPAIFAAWGYGPAEMADGAAAVAQDATEMVRIARAMMDA
ncbi:MAG: phosphoglycolate phosphatase [Rhodospirillales bacterium 69-11]|nr:HAD-IA family hydrolase [Rhodospirillales bacterium]OJW28942.1 MAG: phosphoglycolate phosphatase [Rhodospirillales bacterium 69-11]